MNRSLTFLLGAGLMTALTFPQPASAEIQPSYDGCYTPGVTSAPAGDCGPFRQVFRDTFPAGNLNGCTAGYRCTGAVSVHRSAGDGQLRVKAFRPADGGDVREVTVVPLACRNIRYGKFTERLIVRSADDGYKLAHERPAPDEVSFPEAGGNLASDRVGWFTHGFSERSRLVAGNETWTGWHTYSTEVKPGRVSFFLDGRLVGTATGDYPRAADWLLRTGAGLDGLPARGSSAAVDTTWVTCYKYEG